MNKKKLKNDVVEISELEHNWDGYGAEAFTKEIIDRVNTVIDCLMDEPPYPCIVPSAVGIQFEWYKGKHEYLEISVEGDEISYLRGFGEGANDFVEKKISDLSEVNELLREFYGEEK